MIPTVIPPDRRRGWRGLGDVIEVIAKPIAQAIRSPCLEADGTLRAGSKCAEWQAALNEALPFKGVGKE